METYELYGGKVKLQFDSHRHIYRLDGDRVPSVTGAINVLDRSRPLMWWAVNQSLDFLRKTLKPGIKYDEVQLENFFQQAKYAHQRRRKESLLIGEMVHDWIARGIRGANSKLPLNELARQGCQAFTKWARENSVRFVRSESKVYSRCFHYAGTLDVEAYVNGKLSIIDIKVSNGIYLGMRLQSAAYLQARAEETEKEYAGGCYLVRVDKYTGEPEVVHLAESFECDLQGFLGALALYRRVLEENGRKPSDLGAWQKTLTLQEAAEARGGNAAAG